MTDRARRTYHFRGMTMRPPDPPVLDDSQSNKNQNHRYQPPNQHTTVREAIPVFKRLTSWMDSLLPFILSFLPPLPVGGPFSSPGTNVNNSSTHSADSPPPEFASINHSQTTPVSIFTTPISRTACQSPVPSPNNQPSAPLPTSQPRKAKTPKKSILNRTLSALQHKLQNTKVLPRRRSARLLAAKQPRRHSDLPSDTNSETANPTAGKKITPGPPKRIMPYGVRIKEVSQRAEDRGPRVTTTGRTQQTAPRQTTLRPTASRQTALRQPALRPSTAQRQPALRLAASRQTAPRLAATKPAAQRQTTQRPTTSRIQVVIPAPAPKAPPVLNGRVEKSDRERKQYITRAYSAVRPADYARRPTSQYVLESYHDEALIKKEERSSERSQTPASMETASVIFLERPPDCFDKNDLSRAKVRQMMQPGSKKRPPSLEGKALVEPTPHGDVLYKSMKLGKHEFLSDSRLVRVLQWRDAVPRRLEELSAVY